MNKKEFKITIAGGNILGNTVISIKPVEKKEIEKPKFTKDIKETIAEILPSPEIKQILTAKAKDIINAFAKPVAASLSSNLTDQSKDTLKTIIKGNGLRKMRHQRTGINKKSRNILSQVLTGTGFKRIA